MIEINEREAMDKFLSTAIAAAKSAAAVQLGYFNNNVGVMEKDSTFNLVTEADLKSEDTIVETIRAQFPDHNILAEEKQYGKTDSEYLWIIDPLDGTNNFSCGVPIFASSIALAHRGEIVCGVVYNPILNEMFYAEKGKGAFLNGKRIVVNGVDSFAKALMITGFYYDRGAAMEENCDAIKRFKGKKILGIRRFGAAALDLCFIACGRAAGYWEFKLSPWDFAAGRLIVQEAGGMITDDKNGVLPIDQKSFVVASNGKLHAQMLEIIENKC